MKTTAAFRRLALALGWFVLILGMGWMEHRIMGAYGEWLRRKFSHRRPASN